MAQARRQPIFLIPEVFDRVKAASLQRQISMRVITEMALEQYLDKLDRKLLAKQQAQKSPKGDELQ